MPSGTEGSCSSDQVPEALLIFFVVMLCWHVLRTTSLVAARRWAAQFPCWIYFQTQFGAPRIKCQPKTVETHASWKRSKHGGVTDSGFHGDRSIDHRPSNLKGSQPVSRCHDRSIDRSWHSIRLRCFLGEEEGPAANIERAQFNAVGHPSSRPRPITIKLAAAVCTWKILDLAEQKDLLLPPSPPF